MARSPENEPSSEGEGAASASCLLDTVLSNLYDFGEPSLDVKKKKKGRNRNLHESGINASNPLSDNRGGMKLESDSANQGKRKNPSSFFQSLKDELAHDCITQKKSVSESSTFDAAPPKPAAQIEVVTFHGPKRKKKPKPEIADNDGSKARLEVHRFGITGFEKKEQRVLEQERAIMLGAKAPKKEYLNYKVLQEKIKQNKAMKKKESMMVCMKCFPNPKTVSVGQKSQARGLQVFTSNHFRVCPAVFSITEIRSDSQKRKRTKGHEESRKSKKKTKHSILPTGQVGTFKNGTLRLRKSDIKKIKASKGIN
ncbi:hypothetical protein lerEdw1_006169 [Lerista edwardsae]|nr:hypothetical protein lerEdw1_006169 [Lerista edwardsae]